MQACIIAIGDELLSGKTLDTNSHWTAGLLDKIGIQLQRILIIADSDKDIKAALEESSKLVDLVLITGGLGPTRDDITKSALASFFKVDIIFMEEAFVGVESFFAARGKQVSDTNRQQAHLPANCTPLLNKQGTAPGMWFEEDNTIFVSLPGVPYEMQEMMTEQVIPKLKEGFPLASIIHKHLMTVGIGESFLSDKLKDFEKRLPAEMKLAYLPGLGTVKLRLSQQGDDEKELNSMLDAEIKKLSELIPEYIYGIETDSLESVLGEALKKAGLSLSTAESCTGGYIAHRITSVPGSSEYYMGSVVSYADETKSKLLGVSTKSLSSFGAVSEQVATEMVKGVRHALGTDMGIAVTGIAGPGGGSHDKPVGTTWIAVEYDELLSVKKFQFGDQRDKNIHMTAITAMNMARKILLKNS